MKFLTVFLLTLSYSTSLLAADKESPFMKKQYTFTGGEYKNEVFDYRLMTPIKQEEGKKYPLVVFLHGAGERGSDNEAQLRHFPEPMANEQLRKKYPCFLLVPQCRSGKQWVEVPWSKKKSSSMSEKPGDQLQMAIELIQKTIKEESIDTTRIYLTGLSMGGYGSWELAARHPAWFAAVAPICGGGDEKQAAKFVSLPTWAFHGDKDGAVPVERSRQMIKAIEKAGGKPKYTEFPGVGHNSWVPAYKESSGLLQWMFAQQKKAEQK